MITVIAFVALFGYVWRTRKDLEWTVGALSRRIDRLESQIAVVSRPAPAAVRPAPVSVPPVPMSVPSAEPKTESAPAREEPAPVRPPSWAPERAVYAVATVDESPDSLETEIGSRWLLYVGVVALVIGAAYFQKLAIDNNWIGERARVIEGILAGLCLVAGGQWFVRRGYDVYGQIVAGGGVAVLYVSVYAASTLYELVGRAPAFAALCVVTALAAWLADRYRSQGLAVMAVGGGFVTPFLLPTATDTEVALFSYDGVLIAGTMYLAHRRIWPVLNVVSYVFTALTVAAWAEAFYIPSKYLVTEAYLTIFCGMFLYILFQIRRSESLSALIAQTALWSAPVMYYVASLVVLAPHSIALLVFLGIVASIGAGLAPSGHSIVRLIIWCAVAMPLLAWASSHDDATWLVPGSVAVAGIYLVNLLALLHRASRQEPLAEADIAMLHLNGLVLYGGAHVLVRATYPDAGPLLAFATANWNGVVAVGLRPHRRALALHFAAVAATLLAVAIGLEFDGAARTIGWAVEGAALAWLGLREQRLWLRVGGLAVFAVAIAQLIVLLLGRPLSGYTVVLNWRVACAVVVIGLLYLLAWLHRPLRVGPMSAATPFVMVANVLTLLLITTEINAYWFVRGIASPQDSGRLGRELMLSISWALYATGLIVVGLRRGYAPIRYLAMVVFLLTISKVFFFDLAELEQIYRVSSIIGLGVLLLLTSYLYNRSRARQ